MSFRDKNTPYVRGLWRIWKSTDSAHFYGFRPSVYEFFFIFVVRIANDNFGYLFSDIDILSRCMAPGAARMQDASRYFYYYEW